MDPVPGGQHARQTHLSRGISRLAHGWRRGRVSRIKPTPRESGMVPRLKAAEQFRQKALMHGYFISMLAVAPTFAWILLDTSAWGGDQSQYGRATLELFHALRHSPTEWFTRMFDVF